VDGKTQKSLSRPQTRTIPHFDPDIWVVRSDTKSSISNCSREAWTRYSHFAYSDLFFNLKIGWRVPSILSGSFLPWCSRGGRAAMLFYMHHSEAFVLDGIAQGDIKTIVCSMANIARWRKGEERYSTPKTDMLP
jgi:hypothetical protein